MDPDDDYAPSGEDELYDDDQHDEDDDHTPRDRQERRGRLADFDSNPDSDFSPARPRPLKRPSEDGPASSRSSSSSSPPLKRQRGTFNEPYLELLNRYIEDVASQVLLEPGAGLSDSQLGLTVWTGVEKAIFFDALSRAGRGGIATIASRICTKSEVEVSHYLNFLQAAVTMRRACREIPAIALSEIPAAVELSPLCCDALEEAADGIAWRLEIQEEEAEEDKWGAYWDITPDIAESIEEALEGADEEAPEGAGDDALEQQADNDDKHNDDDSDGDDDDDDEDDDDDDGDDEGEEGEEREAEGDEGEEVEEAEDDDDYDKPGLPSGLRSADLFHMRQWLTLSERFFMNAPPPEDSWQSVAGTPPSIRATAFEDFYILAVSFLRRLIHTSFFVTLSRLRTRLAAGPESEYDDHHVRRRDVEAAVASLGASPNSNSFWVTSARRLQLQVLDEQDTSTDDDKDTVESDHIEPMPYDEVERILQQPQVAVRSASNEPSEDIKEVEETDADQPAPAAAAGSMLDSSSSSDQSSESDDGSESGNSSNTIGDDGLDPNNEELEYDVAEALLYSANILPQTRWGHRTLKLRIQAEHAQDQQAEYQDQLASRQEEAALRDILAEPAQPRSQIGENGAGAAAPRDPDSRLGRKTVDGILAVDQDWRSSVGYIERWEAAEALARISPDQEPVC